MMLSLQRHHIIDIYCWVDDLLPKKSTERSAGRPASLAASEVLTILIWNTLVAQQKTLKDLHRWVAMYHRQDFPKLPGYNTFLDECHRALPMCFELLQLLLRHAAPLRILDATMLPVCKLKRADRHKVAKKLAKFGKNHQGWHYGFKLHASVDAKGRFCALALTPANVHDAQMMPKILNHNARLAVGDTLYGARVMREKIWHVYGTVVIAPPHPKQKRKVATPWQNELLSFRSKIESVFDYLKEHLHLVTSFARSVNGYLLHYLRILLAYQIMAISSQN